MTGRAGKLWPTIVGVAGRVITAMIYDLDQFMSCGCPGDPAAIEVMLSPSGDFWLERVAGSTGWRRRLNRRRVTAERA